MVFQILHEVGRCEFVERLLLGGFAAADNLSEDVCAFHHSFT